MSVSLEHLKFFAKNKSDLYHGIRSCYYIPSFTSKAVTKGYLKEILKPDSSFLKISLEEIHPVHLEFTKIGVDDLLERLNVFLLSKGFKSTGLDSTSTPDVQWLANVCKWADPTDTLCVF